MLQIDKITQSDQIKKNIDVFNAGLNANRDLAIDLAKTTTYWVYDSESGQFGPSKFVGFQDMDFEKYNLCREGNSTGDRFDGAVSRQAIEAALETEYDSNQQLSEKLLSWSKDCLDQSCFFNTDISKWMFVTLTPENINSFPFEIDSWTIISPTVFIKKMDRSAFLHHGSGIPIGIRKYFDIDQLAYAQRVNIRFIYKTQEFTAYFEKLKSSRTRLMWNSDFEKVIQTQFSDVLSKYKAEAQVSENDRPLLVLKKGGTSEYSVEFRNPNSNISDEKIDQLITLFQKQYPTWQSFEDQDYLDNEYQYKLKASEKAQELLGKELLQQLLNQEKFDVIIQRVEKVASLTNLLYIKVPKTGDLAILYSESLIKKEFCTHIFNLIYGQDTIENRFKVYFDYLNSKHLPNRWTLPTLLLYLLFPTEHIFVKPSATTWLLKFIDLPVKIEGKPKIDDYILFKNISHELFAKLAPYKPRNMIDIQSFIWVCFNSSKNNSANYWWVNQGKSYDEEKTKGIIWAPYKNESGDSLYHWDNVSKVKANDVILHYSQGFIRSVSTALAGAEDIDNPHEGAGSGWQKKGRQVRLKYKELIPPINLEKIQTIDDVLEIDRGPLDKNRDVKQGYLFSLSEDAYNQICKLFTTTNTWIFQANPNRYRAKDAIKHLQTLTWLMNRNTNKATLNDKVFIWESGENAGIVGIGTIIELPSEREQFPDEKSFVADPNYFAGKKARVVLRVEQTFPKTILRTELIKNSDIAQFEIIKQPNATNYLLNESETQILENVIAKIMKTKDSVLFPLNTILYGPPGTGKTYATYERALKIVDPDFVSLDRDSLMGRYKSLRKTGQIQFITFHQSYSYEEFIEGIRPELDSEHSEPKYELKDGVLKKIARMAAAEFNKTENGTQINFDQVNVFKMSLGMAGRAEDSIYEFCTENNCISIGYGGENVDFSPINSISDKESARKQIEELYASDLKNTGPDGPSMLFSFICKMRVGDLVFVSYGNKTIRAVGIVTGEYRFDKGTEIEYCHFRNVKWLLKDVDVPVEKISKKGLMQKTIYQIAKQNLILENLENLVSNSSADTTISNYVLIIDEINRGNISKIFGEAITLLDPDKRLGAENEVAITLPYSQDDFALPTNLYILGTMNTADRSIALMDIALRRRFKFEEIMPDPAILVKYYAQNSIPLDLSELLLKVFKTLNMRIAVLIDKNHQIGHSYFLKIRSETDLFNVWYHEIMPLLQEYFYNDWDRLKLLLGSATKGGFVVETLSNPEYAGLFTAGDPDYPCDFKVCESPAELIEVLKKAF